MSGLEPSPSRLLGADPSPPFLGPCGPEPCLTKALLPCHTALRKSDQLPDGSGATGPRGLTWQITQHTDTPGFQGGPGLLRCYAFRTL